MNRISLFLLVAILGITQSQLFNRRKHVVKYPPSNDLEKPLLITPYLKANKIEEARLASQVNYTGFQNVVSFSGYFVIDELRENKIFYWFFPSENDFENDPVVLWLQGGPGSSSLQSLFKEHGPFKITKNLDVELREYSWNKNQSVLYIDSPAGTGFSYFRMGQFAENQTKISNDLYLALTQFFTLFPEVDDNDFFIAGEGYGGKCVTSLGHAIHMNNEIGASLQINLQGLLIENGWIDPVNMFVYSDYLYSLGLLDSNQRDTMKAMEQETVRYIEEEDYINSTYHYELLIGFEGGLYKEYTGSENVHNYLKQFNDDDDYYLDFINQGEVREAIHVGSTIFGLNDFDVFMDLYEDVTTTIAPVLAELLSYHRVLIFNGQYDVLVGYPLTESYLQKLNFSSAAEYKRAERNFWEVNYEIAGYVKVAGNLTEVLVRNASNAVAVEQPKRAWKLIYDFVRNNPLVD